MVSARDARDATDAALAAARESSGKADMEWRDHLGGAAFDPSYGRWLADRVVTRTSQQAQTEARADLTRRSAERRQDEWQLLEAQVRSNEARAGELTSRVAHLREEKRLHAVADRVTYDRVKP